MDDGEIRQFLFWIWGCWNHQVFFESFHFRVFTVVTGAMINDGAKVVKGAMWSFISTRLSFVICLDLCQHHWLWNRNTIWASGMVRILWVFPSCLTICLGKMINWTLPESTKLQIKPFKAIYVLRNFQRSNFFTGVIFRPFFVMKAKFFTQLINT